MTQTLTFRLARIPTPIGAMLIATDEQDRLRVLDWDEHVPRMERLLQRHYGGAAVLKDGGDASHPIAERLRAYVAGDIAAIDDIPTQSAGTPFQREVWAALREIPAGETWSYGRLAAHIGRPAAVRAVGLANGANPIGVVVPCHRVIGANGTLTGYGGGIARKRWLLEHEGVRLKEERLLL
ncbi:MAG: methylated-DNA--protein-cysteine methyltransferase [Caulobacteraceae bacterium]|nr:methylated-DNA--protein-cysteine methyltransferase [Caulobacteraceae bacterium]